MTEDNFFFMVAVSSCMLRAFSLLPYTTPPPPPVPDHDVFLVLLGVFPG